MARYNILTISSLFPNKNDPKHGIFVKTRLKHLLEAHQDISAAVVAPIPWFPFKNKLFGEYAKYAGVPSSEIIDGITVYHPKFLVLPKVGMYLTPIFMYWAIRPLIRQLVQKQQIDLIDGHYFYPDGVAINKIAKEFDLPFTCTARGTDINLIPTYPKALKQLKRVFEGSSHMMAVCKALKDEMISLGVPDDRVTVLRNGVDLNLFKYSTNTQQSALKKSKNITGKLILSVGWLIERKGHHLVIEALRKLSNTQLVIAGDGPELDNLMRTANQCGVSDRVTFIGAVSQDILNSWMMAADALVLASSREGWANVLLEAMASGTPVVATDVWGTPEVVQPESCGVLVTRTSDSIASGLDTLLKAKIDRAAVRNYAEKFSWSETSDGMRKIIKEILEK